jgi:hypothetical protein
MTRISLRHPHHALAIQPTLQRRSSRTSAAPAPRLSSGRCCISARSMTAGAGPGARRSKPLMKAGVGTGSWRCPIAKFRPVLMATACMFGSMRWNRTDRGSGAHAGWRVISMTSWNSIGSGRSVCRIRGKGSGGDTSCRRWCATGWSIPAANGGCTGSGSSRARWEICCTPVMRDNCPLPLSRQAAGA